TRLHSGQANHFVGCRTQGLGGQAQDAIPRTKAATVSAVVIVAHQPHVPHQGEEGALPPADAAGASVAGGAVAAGTLIPPFFRSSRGTRRKTWSQTREGSNRQLLYNRQPGWISRQPIHLD